MNKNILEDVQVLAWAEDKLRETEEARQFPLGIGNLPKDKANVIKTYFKHLGYPVTKERQEDGKYQIIIDGRILQ